MNRKLAFALLTFAALVPYSPAAAQQPPGKPPATPTKGATVPDTNAAKAPIASRETMVEKATARIWWNQEVKIRELQITAVQRQSFDRLLREFLLADSPPPADSYERMGEKLAAGDAVGARKAIDEAVQAVEAPLRRQGELMIAVVGQLTAAQRKILDQSYPQLLRRPWVRALQPQRRGGPPASKKAPRN